MRGTARHGTARHGTLWVRTSTSKETGHINRSLFTLGKVPLLRRSVPLLSRRIYRSLFTLGNVLPIGMRSSLLRVPISPQSPEVLHRVARSLQPRLVRQQRSTACCNMEYDTLQHSPACRAGRGVRVRPATQEGHSTLRTAFAAAADAIVGMRMGG